jgi:hypothetical protein
MPNEDEEQLLQAVAKALAQQNSEKRLMKTPPPTPSFSSSPAPSLSLQDDPPELMLI